MIGISLFGHDLANRTNRIFDVKVGEFTCIDGCRQMMFKQIEMEACSRAHWSSIPEVMERY